MSEIKSKSIFDFLNDLTYNKIAWREQSEMDRKKIQPYMLNRWLSMHPDYLELVSECQPTTDLLETKQYYQFYQDLLPKKKFFTKYISRKNEKEKSFTKLIEFLSNKLETSKIEMEEYLEILFEMPEGYSKLKEFIKGYGYGEKEINKEFGI